MRVLIIGATGFLGANLVIAAREAGHAVRAFCHGTSDTRFISLPGVQKVGGDLFDLPSLEQAMRDIDVVFHAAGPYPVFSLKGKKELARASRSALNILAAAEKIGSPRLVYTSSLTTIGRRFESARLADEAVAFNRRGYLTPYFDMKILMEEIFIEAAGKGYPVVIVNPTFCFGRYDLKPARRLVRQVARGRMPFYMEAPLNFADARDVAQGHLLAAEKGTPGERYILGGENIMFSQVLRTIAEVCGLAPPRIRLPFLFGLGAALASETVSLITRKPPPVPLVGVELLRFSQFLDCQKAREKLGYRTRYSVKETIEDAVAWLREIGQL